MLRMVVLSYKNMIKKRYIIVALSGLLAGCQTALEVEPVVSDAFEPIRPGAEQRKIAFAGGMFDLTRGDLYVAYPYWHWSVPNVNVGFYICNPTLKHRFARSQGYWNEDDNIFGSWPEEAGDLIEKTLDKLGYNIKLTRHSFFEKKAGKPKADLLLSLKVTDMKFNMCYIHEPITIQSMNRAGGNGNVTVEWEVFDTIREKVIGSYITQGYGHIDEPLQAGDKAVFVDAVQNAAENLGRTEWFKKIMTTMDPADLIPDTEYAPLSLSTKADEFHQPIRSHFALTRKAMVTIHAGGESKGSGFFIDNEGHILTTAHVVGETDFVQVMDVNGTKYRAKVIRLNERRNVALIKADLKDNLAMPISKAKENELTETVYAIGTPFQNSYRATITKGIIAANRYQKQKNMSYIQASIPTAEGYEGGPLTDEFGNVIGLADTESRREETNFSFFIPIKEALKALNLKINKI